MSKVKRIIFVRHAHRDKQLGASQDNGLSEMGQQQTQTVVDHWAGKPLGESVVVHSSPKLRCQETAKPIAKHFGVQLQVLDSLDEQTGSETFADLKYRIKNYLLDWKNAPEDTRFCISHGDWIPVAIQMEISLDFPIDLAESFAIEFDGTRSKILPD